MASLSTCHLGLWLGWQILLNNTVTTQISSCGSKWDMHSNLEEELQESGLGDNIHNYAHNYFKPTVSFTLQNVRWCIRSSTVHIYAMLTIDISCLLE